MDCAFDETTKKDTSQYDMIIGTDLMSELQVKIDYETHEIEWDDVTIPMKQRGTLSDPEMTHDIYEFTKESSVLKMSEDRHNEIIKAMYGKIDHFQTNSDILPTFSYIFIRVPTFTTTILYLSIYLRCS